jgi:hypothetical protein
MVMMKGMPVIMVGEKKSQNPKSNSYIHKVETQDNIRLWAWPILTKYIYFQEEPLGKETSIVIFGGVFFFVVSMIVTCACANATMWQRPSSASSMSFKAFLKGF